MPMYASLTGVEVRALLAYLRTVPAIHNEVRNAVPAESPVASRGEAFYRQYRLCHGDNGIGQ
jgi:hypothetical protein